MKLRWLCCALAVPLTAGAQERLNVSVDSTLAKSAAAVSMLRAREILSQTIDAMRDGGVDALRGLSSISTERVMLRTSTGQGMHPGAPAVEHAVLLTSFDLKNSRLFTLRDLEIDGGQMWASGAFITPSTGYDMNYANRTYRTAPAAQYTSLRASVIRGELPLLLRSAWYRPESLRSLGQQLLRGRACDVISFADADATLVTLYVDRERHLVVRSEVLRDDPTRGDQVIPTDYSDYRVVKGLRLPFRSHQDGPGPESWESTLTKVEIDAPISDTLFSLPKGMELAAQSGPLTKVAEGVYRMPASAAIEFRDFVVVFEAYGSSGLSDGNIGRVRATFPGKPIRYVVSSHYHEDHLGGVRPYAAEGVTFLTTTDAARRIESVLAGRHVMRPDTLSVRPVGPKIEIVEQSRIIDDSTRRLVLYQVGPTAHVDKILIGYLPKEKVLIEGDLLDIPDGKPSAGGEDTEQLATKLREMGLEIDRIIPIHGSPGTKADLDRAVKMHRARASCSQQLVQRLFCDFWSDR